MLPLIDHLENNSCYNYNIAEIIPSSYKGAATLHRTTVFEMLYMTQNSATVFFQTKKLCNIDMWIVSGRAAEDEWPQVK